MWIYWKEQCIYCKNRIKCEHIKRVQRYIKEIDAVSDRGVYGTLKWECDYFNFDEEEYIKKNYQEINGGYNKNNSKN